LQEALIEATHKTAKIAHPSETAILWWNTKIQHALKITHDWKTKAKQELHNTNSISSDTNRATNRAVRNLRNEIKTEKRNWLQKTLEEADTNNIWVFRKWSKGSHNYPTPPISRGPNRPKAIYAFKPPPDLPNTNTPNLTHENPNNIPWYPITREEVRKVIFHPCKTKALGFSQISYEILR
jgi:hypothetical protein